MRDDDRLLNLPNLQFGAGIIGVCDICGERQAVVVLTKERYKLCVLDFLNKTWLKTDKKPGVPAPLYRSERVTFETVATPAERAQAIVLSPTKRVKHPVVLLTPDTFGITTTLLDGAIRLAREGFEVLIPDLLKSKVAKASLHLSLRSNAQFRGGVDVRSERVTKMVRLYGDALTYLRSREMVDPSKSAVFGTSYGASLALALAAGDTRLAAVALAYPMPVVPPDLANLVTAPVLLVRGSSDRSSVKAWKQLIAAQSATKATFEFVEVPGVRHGFLSRDLPAYQVGPAELAWGRIVAFLAKNLMPPPPKPPTMPSRAAPSPPAAPAAAKSPAGAPPPAAKPAPSSAAPSAPSA